jgi:uncharacterized protein (TIGR03086 family)
VELTTALEETFGHTQGVIANVRPEQYDDKTPCAEWTVRELMEHMIGVVAGMGAAASGQARREFALGPDPAAQFQEAATVAVEAWRTPGVMERIVDAGPGPMPGRVLAGINLLDTATHTWDLAVATGQPAALPDGVAEAAMEASQEIVSPELRPGRFGPETAAPQGAGATERLVAFLGRTP